MKTRKTRELLYAWFMEDCSVLVPKKRGDGFLLTPLWHKHDQALSDIADIARCDVSGLDGHLLFECGAQVTQYPERRAAWIAKVMPALEAHYGCGSREIGKKEFFDLHPCKTQSAPALT